MNRSHVRTAGLALVTATLACAPPPRPGPLPEARVAADTLVHSTESLPPVPSAAEMRALLNDLVYFEEFDAAAAAAGLEPLTTTPLPAGVREVRIWWGGGLGYPQDLYRVQVRDRRVEGERIAYWRRDRDPEKPDSMRYEALIRYYQAGRCGEITATPRMEACRVRFTRPPDWRRALERATATGMWTLRDESALPGGPRIYLHASSMTVELRDGARYRRYRFHPRQDSVHAEYGQALAVFRAFAAVDSLARTPDVLRVYRGVFASGPSLMEFRPCGADVAWRMDGDLRGLERAWSDRPRADTVETGVLRQYVEVRGTLAPEWLTRSRKSEYPRELFVHQVLAAREWDPALCRER